MKKIFMLLGARTPILSILMTILFFSILIYSANIYQVDHLVKLDVEIESYSNNEVIFSYKGKEGELAIVSHIYLGYSQQTTLLEGTIVNVINRNHVAKVNGLEKINRDLLNTSHGVIKIIDKKEPIIRRLIR